MATYTYTYPTGYYDYSTSASTSPAPDVDGYLYTIPAQYSTPPSKRHTRTASYHTPPGAHYRPSPQHYDYYASYSSPRGAGYDHVSAQQTSARKPPRFPTPGAISGDDDEVERRPREATSKPKTRSQRQHIYNDGPGKAQDRSREQREPLYHHIAPKLSVARETSYYTKKSPRTIADPDFYFTQTYNVNANINSNIDTPTRSRARRASTTQTRPKTAPSKPSPKPSPPEATAADAARHQIPAGYSLKNWDPTEEPILLLGSAFDANSLGKWIYDWTVYHHKAGAPITEVAGELWLLLIKFAGKMRRAEECVPRIRSRAARDLVAEFLDSGDRIWGKLKVLLKLCEDFMYRAAHRDGRKRGGGASARVVAMGESSGIEFVRTVFGRERELERTEKLMTSVRLWNMRFDANCEDILRRPGAK